MPRANSSVPRKKRHKKIIKSAKGYFGTRKSNYRTAKDAVQKALQYSYENGDVLSVDCMKSACRHNNLDMIKYLIEKNCPLNINCFILLAAQKRPDSIVYMYENGYCPVDIRITNAAATPKYPTHFQFEFGANCSNAPTGLS